MALIDNNSGRGALNPFPRDRMAAAGSLRDGATGLLAGGGRDLHAPGRRSPQFDRRVAVHESGHAVSSHLLGLPVAGATIEFIDGHHGLTWATDGPLQAGETVDAICRQLTPLMSAIGDRADIATELLQAADQVISLLAGVEAERLFCAELMPNTEHDEIDARQIAALICRSERAVDTYLDFCRIEARALLTGHRDAVLAIADALVEHHTLNGAAIDAIIGKEMRYE
jgi:hypothetical protein